MKFLLVVDNDKQWIRSVTGAEVVSSRTYLSENQYGAMSQARVINLCRSYRYQSSGYYVSLLAMARGHRPLPSVVTTQDIKLASIRRLASEEMQDLIKASLGPLKSTSFELSVYFGRNLAARYDRLSLALFNLFPAPMLRARFQAGTDGWSLESLKVIGTSSVPLAHRPFLLEQIRRHAHNGRRPGRAKRVARYELAILHEPGERLTPSSPRTLKRFVQAASAADINARLITRDDFGRLAEFDALFIRTTTAVNHYTFRFARRAAAEGLFVIDDPDSILRCGNKVYLAELLSRHKIPTPHGTIFGSDNTHLVAEHIGFPCVVKLPDSAFSAGVKKFDCQEDFEDALPTLFAQSELLLAQEFAPTAFDWRIGVLGGQPLFACKYHMARAHWQIIKHDHEAGRVTEGNAETIAIQDAPASVVKTAVRAANLIGRGMYGVDVKVLGGRPKVIEVNDNPNIDAGYEDKVLGRDLYTRIMKHFLDELERMRRR